LTLIELTFFLKRNNYHIVHTHNSKAGFIGRLAAILAGVPVIIHTVHGFAFHDQEPAWRQFLFRNLERLASRWCDKMIFISQPLIEWALREQVAIKEKIVKIYSGIDLDLFQPVTADKKLGIRAGWGIAGDDKVIGIVSKLWEGKGHDILIKAFKKIIKERNDVKLIIVGEGYLMEDLVKLVEKLDITSSVLFTGFQADVSGIISTFDIGVLPSFFEGMGRVLLEAMAMEKPVVASNVGGIPDLVDNGINGFLTKPGDIDELYDALNKLLNNHELSINMGKQGRKKVSDKFSSKAMVKLIHNLYTECLAKKKLL
jgi:glycosyltransferase involved in cell wall biosynthesis